MPNIARTKQIIKHTPEDQAILLVGIHGIGKSEISKQILEELGYATITFFLGQMSDAGDLIGLPDKTEVEFKYGDRVVRQKITEFCPPKWWPRDSNAKIAIIMDEFNRGKPDVYQCIFDMILNKNLNGLKLPDHTRIIACMNPIGDEYEYDVQDLDFALKDRFNIYEFLPDPDEWIDYAVKTKHNKYVISFIVNNRQHLDPPKRVKSNEVYPSRRSWTRVSNLINENPDIVDEEDGNLLSDVLFGMVGLGATNMFISYTKEMRTKISGAKIVTGWDLAVKAKVMNMSKQDIVHLNQEIAIYIDTEYKTLFDASSKTEAEQYANNVATYLRVIEEISPELRGEFFDHVLSAHAEGKEWPYKLLDHDRSGLVDTMINSLHGDYEANKIDDSCQLPTDPTQSQDDDDDEDDLSFGDKSSIDPSPIDPPSSPSSWMTPNELKDDKDDSEDKKDDKKDNNGSNPLDSFNPDDLDDFLNNL